jgi:hypothetical protein
MEGSTSADHTTQNAQNTQNTQNTQNAQDAQDAQGGAARKALKVKSNLLEDRLTLHKEEQDLRIAESTGTSANDTGEQN